MRRKCKHCTEIEWSSGIGDYYRVFEKNALFSFCLHHDYNDWWLICETENDVGAAKIKHCPVCGRRLK